MGHWGSFWPNMLHLLRAFTACCRVDGMIVAEVAATAIAALQYDCGRTAHGLFGIPVTKAGEEDIPRDCFLDHGSARAAFLRAIRVLVWDEVSMSHRFHVEAVDRLLRLLHDTDAPFGGKLVIFTGDWLQTLPVVPQRCAGDALLASASRSPVLRNATTLQLT
eukprot:gene5326-7530_t